MKKLARSLVVAAVVLVAFASVSFAGSVFYNGVQSQVGGQGQAQTVLFPKTTMSATVSGSLQNTNIVAATTGIAGVNGGQNQTQGGNQHQSQVKFGFGTVQGSSSNSFYGASQGAHVCIGMGCF
jgi:hypothetical protein